MEAVLVTNSCCIFFKVMYCKNGIDLNLRELFHHNSTGHEYNTLPKARKKQCSYAHFKQKLVSISLYGAVGACLQ